MSGYLGTKAVLLSTTAANVTGNATITGDLTVDTDTLYVDSTNNRVGIGTSSPSEKLTVAVPSNSGGALFYGGTQSDRGLSLSVSNAGGFDNSFWYLNQTANNSGSTLAFGTRNAEAMRIDSSGNVGIGTSSPDTLMELVSLHPTLTVRDSDSTTSTALATLRLAESGASDALGSYWDITAKDSAWQLAFTHSSAGEAMRIDSSGNLLVGKTSTNIAFTGTALEAGGRQLTTTNGGDCAIFNRLGTDGSILNFRKDGTTVGSISVTASATAYNTSSDYRLKEAWVPMVGASERVQSLKPINFAWKVDGSRVDGFLAHELAEVVPEAVTGTKDAMRDEEYEVTPAVEATYDAEGVVLTPAVPAVMGTRSVPDMQAIDQSKLVPLLTAALQEALTEISDLKARVTALEAV